MPIDNEILGVASGVISSIVSTSIAWGVMRQKIEHLEKTIDSKVDIEVFRATMKPIHDDLHEMRGDLKELLKTIQRHDSISFHHNSEE